MYAVHRALLRCINTLGRPISIHALAASRTKLMECWQDRTMGTDGYEMSAW